MTLAFVIGLPPFGDVRRLWGCPNPVVLNKLGIFGMFPMNREDEASSGSQLDTSRAHGVRRIRRGVSALLNEAYVAKLFLFQALGCRVPFRPADLARGHPSPPPEVPREVALVRKTSRQGYFR
jgi:hypothetical protein